MSPTCRPMHCCASALRPPARSARAACSASSWPAAIHRARSINPCARQSPTGRSGRCISATSVACRRATRSATAAWRATPCSTRYPSRARMSTPFRPNQDPRKAPRNTRRRCARWANSTWSCWGLARTAIRRACFPTMNAGPGAMHPIRWRSSMRPNHRLNACHSAPHASAARAACCSWSKAKASARPSPAGAMASASIIAPASGADVLTESRLL